MGDLLPSTMRTANAITATQTRASSQLSLLHPDILARAYVLNIVKRTATPNSTAHSTIRSGPAAPDSTAIASKVEFPVLATNDLLSSMLLRLLN